MALGAIISLFIGCGRGSAATLYVAPEGQTGWSGKLPTIAGTDGPLPTLQAARDRIRERRAAGVREHETVYLRGGTYTLQGVLELNFQDSDVSYVSYKNEVPVISGAAQVKSIAAGTGGLWVTAVDEKVHELFVNGTRAIRSRMPETGFYTIDGLSSIDKPFTLKFKGNDIRQAWANSGAEVVALLAWAEIRMPISAVNTETRTATLLGVPHKSNREINARYWVENIPGEVSHPGEWYWDQTTKVLRYLPRPGEMISQSTFTLPKLMTLISVKGDLGAFAPVRDITFQGVTFEYTDWNTPDSGYAGGQGEVQAPAALEAEGVENLVVQDCTFAHLGGYAVALGKGAKGNVVQRNKIFDTGAGGIKIGEMASRPETQLQTLGNKVEDNDIHDIGMVYPAAIGIWVGQSAENVIAHNHLHNFFYTAISVGWTWGYSPNNCHDNLIEGNLIHDIGQKMLSDMGGIYTLGVQHGTVIRNNLIYNVNSYTYGGWGIYLDEGSSDILVENNIVHHTKSAGFDQHYGRDNIIRNNIFAYSQEFQLSRTKAEDHNSFTFESNIVEFDNGKLLDGDWTGGLKIDRNLYWNNHAPKFSFGEKTWEQWRQDGRDNNSKIQNPGFVNATSFDFRLKPDSPAYSIGFHSIDMLTVGPRTANIIGAKP